MMFRKDKTMFSGKKTYDKDAPKIKKIDSFEIITLHLSGMRYTQDFEFTPDGENTRLVLYGYRYRQDGHDRVPEQIAVRPTDEVLDILNDCDVGKWSGFHGAHPPHVLDGTMFRLSGTVNGGVELHADGSENFPPNYRKFTDYLYEKIHEGEKVGENE